MNSSIRDLKQLYNRLLVVAATNRKAINVDFKRASELESNVHELLLHANNLTAAVNNVLQGVDRVTKHLLHRST